MQRMVRHLLLRLTAVTGLVTSYFNENVSYGGTGGRKGLVVSTFEEIFNKF